jgi:unsaturated rhamnogalacturonyl hydrolase
MQKVLAFLLAAGEMEQLTTQAIGKGKNVVLDRWFNSEKRKDATGAEQYWHYTWEERSHPGYYTWEQFWNVMVLLKQ